MHYFAFGYCFCRTIQQYEKSPSSSKKKKDPTTNTNSTSNNIIQSGLPNSTETPNVIPPNQLLEQNTVEAMETEEQQQQFSSILSSSSELTSSESASSITFNANVSSSNRVINSLLPRPPLPISRDLNIDDIIENIEKNNDIYDSNDVDQNNHLLEYAIPDDYNNLPINDEIVHEANNDLTNVDLNILNDIRRSHRKRAKPKRFYSPDRTEDQANMVKKKKKRLEK